MDSCKYATRVIFESAIIPGYYELESEIFDVRGIISANELVAADKYIKQVMQDRILVYLKSSLRRIRSFPTCSISGKNVELIVENENPYLLSKFNSYFICRDCEKNCAENEIKNNNGSLIINFTGNIKNASYTLAEELGYEIVKNLNRWQCCILPGDNKTVTINGSNVTILPS